MRQKGFDHRVIALPQLVKRAVMVTIDIIACALSVVLAIYLRIDQLPAPSTALLAIIALATLTAVPAFFVLGLYRVIIHRAGWSALATIMRGVLLSSIPMIAIVTMIGVPGIPRTVGVLQPILLLLLIGAARAAARGLLSSRRAVSKVHRARPRALIYGAGSAGRQMCSALHGSNEFTVVGYVDDEPTLQGRSLNNVHIYPPAMIGSLVENGVSHIMLAVPSASRQRRNDIIAMLRAFPVHVQTLPAVSDLVHGRVSFSDLRELEVEDLLGREPVSPNAILLARNIAGKVVVVTGGGGSIGSELCRQILALRPRTLLLVEANEFALYTIFEELRRHLDDDSEEVVVPLLASVRDGRRMREIIAAWKPDTIYHAAAYKHVPMVEHNIVEGVRNNVWGTMEVARAARDAGVADMVLVSTDKAVRPTNVMGASKRLAEMVLQAFAAKGGRTRFSMVRFGNVLGSSGSVVPLFRRQIRDGGPVTITHREITRYFMTVPEAAQLVIQAGAMAAGGEVFVLDMGEPVRIVDLARNMIVLSGYSVRDDDNPEGDIELRVTGLRPGEKLYEELLIGDNPEPTRHRRIMKADERFLPSEVLLPRLAELDAALDDGDVVRVRGLLTELVPEYRPQGGVVDWVEVRRAASA